MAKENEQLSELLSAYVDGELDERDSQRAAGILRQDPQARQLYADLKRTRELVQTLPRHAAPASIAIDVLARLERSALLPETDAKPRAVRRRRRWWRAPLSIAAVLAICAAGWWTLLLSSGDRGQLVDSSLTPTRGLSDARTTPSEETVEKKLAAGVKLAALQQHPFANEPVRLQLVVDNERERDEVARQVTRQLAAANLPDLAVEASKRKDAAEPNAAPSQAAFFYQGKAGVNFADADSRQILVRAFPGQVKTVLKEVDRVARRDEQVALQAGPLLMQGRKSIGTLQLFAESASPQAAGAIGAKERALSTPRGELADAKHDEEATRFVNELLAIAKIDPAKLASADGRRSESDARRGRTSGDVRAPLSPAAAGNETKMEVAKANTEAVKVAPSGPATSAGTNEQPENHLTFILEIVTKPKSSAPNERPHSRAGRV